MAARGEEGHKKVEKREIRGQCHRTSRSITLSASCVQQQAHQYTQQIKLSELLSYLRSIKYDSLENTAVPASAASLAGLCPSVGLGYDYRIHHALGNIPNIWALAYAGTSRLVTVPSLNLSQPHARLTDLAVVWIPLLHSFSSLCLFVCRVSFDPCLFAR